MVSIRMTDEMHTYIACIEPHPPLPMQMHIPKTLLNFAVSKALPESMKLVVKACGEYGPALAATMPKPPEIVLPAT